MDCEPLAGSYLLSPASDGGKSGSGSLVEACSLTAPQSTVTSLEKENELGGEDGVVRALNNLSTNFKQPC